MNLAQFFEPDLIDVDLKADSKHHAVEKLAELFCTKYPDRDKQEIIKAVNEREKLGSTSFGRGFAFPHARTDMVDDLHIAFGIAKKGILDQSPDCVPLIVVCLILTPHNISKLYLQALSGLANFARRPEVIEQLLAVNSPSELIEIIEKANIEVSRALTVKDIMTENLVSVHPDDLLRKVANIIFQYGFNGVPVIVSQGKLVGDISDRDLLRSALPDYDKLISDVTKLTELKSFEELLQQADKLHVKDVMRREAPTIPESAPVVEAAALMLVKNVARVFAMRGEQPVGIISRYDIIAKFMRG
jgi:mannitol/fructose-specific phosphotransferase system IIA component (Ntr-type)/CBS domain-containing protein